MQLKCLAESERSMNWPVGTLFHPRSRAGTAAAENGVVVGRVLLERQGQPCPPSPNLTPRLRTLTLVVAFRCLSFTALSPFLSFGDCFPPPPHPTPRDSSPASLPQSRSCDSSQLIRRPHLPGNSDWSRVGHVIQGGSIRVPLGESGSGAGRERIL